MGLCISKNPPSYKEIKDIKDKEIKKILDNNFKDVYEIKYFIDLVIIVNNSTGKVQYLKKRPSKNRPNVYEWVINTIE